MVFDYAGRVARLQELMRQSDVDSMVLAAGSDMPYLCGYTAMPLERLTALVIESSGPPVLFVPELEAPRVRSGNFEMVPWGEREDPVSLVAERIGGHSHVAVGDNMWSTFLLHLQEKLPGVGWTIASNQTRELRMRKDDQEIANLRAAAEATDRVLARVPHEVRFSGRTERQIARDFADMVTEEGHDQSWFTLIASGPNGASPHHEPGERDVGAGDMVVCDFGGSVNGYHSDVTRTFVVGTPSERQAEVHGLVVAANAAGRAKVAPGVSCEEIDQAARAVIDDAGYGEYFIHRTGHGIGLEGHEHPYIIDGNSLELEHGMTFSVEPGIYIPGEFGVRIEDIVACGSDGVDDLNLAERNLVEVA